jgi:DNA polymerase-4
LQLLFVYYKDHKVNQNMLEEYKYARNNCRKSPIYRQAINHLNLSFSFARCFSAVNRMYSKRKIVHIDMDAFFASIEQKDNPAFSGKPLIVGGKPQSRGVVAACSYEARRFGIHSAMPCSQAVRLCPQAIFTKPRMDRYREISTQVMAIFHRYTQLVEPLSLDEAFLDVTTNSQNHPSATILAERIRSQIYQELRLTASAGVSFNKFLAKVASDFKKPDGLTTIPPAKAIDFLSSLPIRKFFGVGKVTEKKMLSLGIRTGYDLRQLNEEKLIFHFGKIGSFLYNIVRGIDDRPVEPERVRKSIGSETTLSYDTDDKSEISIILTSLAEQVEQSLKKKQTGGYTLTLKVRYRDFTTITRSQTVRTPIYSSHGILSLLPGLLAATDAGTQKIRLLGLSISKLTGDRKVPNQLLLPFMHQDRL